MNGIELEQNNNTVTPQPQPAKSAEVSKPSDESFRRVMDKYNPNKNIRDAANKPKEVIPVVDNKDTKENNYLDKRAVQKMMQDRLARQGKSFEQRLAAYQKRIEELEAKTKEPEVELTREDFASKQEYENYLAEQGVKQVRDIAKETITQELTQKELKQKEIEEQKEFANNVQKQVKILFPDESKRKEAVTTIQSWKEDLEVEDFLETKHGEIFNEVISESPIGVLIAHTVAKTYKSGSVENWVKNDPETFRAKLKTIEASLINKIRGANKKPAEVVNQEAVNKNTRVLPNTGRISASGKSISNDPRDVLRRVFPNKYK